MSESEEKIARLVRDGLDCYGRGDGVRAVERWREALRLDPNNSEARDYLETAQADDLGASAESKANSEEFEFEPGVLGSDDPPEAQIEATHRARVDALVHEAQQLLRDEALEDALDLLRTAAGLSPSRVEIEGYVDMVRSRLLKRYRKRLGDSRAVPRVAMDSSHITRYNLPPDAGFVLSLVDGATSYDDLVSLSGMDTFEALRILSGLLDAGIVDLTT